MDKHTSVRQRVTGWLAPKRVPLSAGRYLYWVGPAGIEPVTKSSRLHDVFHGIGDDTDGDLTQDPQGWARAYKRSAWAFRCVLVRAQTLAAIPLNVVGPDDAPADGHPLTRAFGGNNTRLMFHTECDRQVFGPAYWAVGQNRLKRLNPQTIEIIATKDGVQGYKQVIDGQVIATFEPGELVHFWDYDPDDDFGAVSAMSLALAGIEVTVNIGAFAAYFFKNGAMPAGILVSATRLNESDRERVLSEWRRRFEGVDKSHGTALLENGAFTYQPITPPLKDLAMAELREEERREIAAAFGVPMTIALMTEAANYATSKQDYVNFHTLTIKPELDLLVDTMNRDLVPLYGVPGVRIEPDWDEVEALQEDRGEVTGRAAQAFPAGVMSLNDALRLQNLEPIAGPDGTERDYFQIAGKLVPRAALEAGDLSAFEPPPAPAPSFPFLSMPPQLAPPSPWVLDQPPGKSVVEINISAPDAAKADTLRSTVMRDTMLRDLDRWQRKIAKKGLDTPFEPDYLPDAVTAWLRQDLSAWDGEGDRATWVKRAFETAAAWVKADDEDDLATPAEFEAYWRGIENLFAAMNTLFDSAWTNIPEVVASALRDGGVARAEDALVAALSHAQEHLTAMLVGEDDNPGPLTAVFLAGAARGNDLLNAGKTAKAEPLTVDWTTVDQLAKAWAAQYAGELVRGINDTTLTIFREKIAAWIDSGGSIEDLAKAIEGDLAGLDMPADWSPGKLQWATSRDRARLIAQTETTAAFHEGAVSRWEQADVPRKKFRTAQDDIVCKEICRPLNNAVTGLRDQWVHPQTGARYGLPAHGGCRCFAAPDGV